MKAVVGLYAVLIFVGLTVALPTRAVDSAFADIQRILDAGVVRVAILARDVPPMIMTAPDGSPAGAEADLARDLAEKLGVEVEFVRSAETYNDVIGQVAGKQADLGISFLSSGVSRALEVYFSRPYIRQSGRLFYNRTNFARLKRDFDAGTIQELVNGAAGSSLIIGVIEGSVYQTMMERDFSQIQVQHYANLMELMQAVREDKIFGGAHGDLQIAFFMCQYPSTAIHVAIDPEVRRPSDICIAVRPDAPNLLRWVDTYLANNVGSRESADIVEQYVELSEDE
jgi:polar amino acid transport system substrate-binding protein